MKINNRRYLGNKYKLLDFISETVNNECDNIETVFDVFAGTGSVASAFVDKKLITNDILYSNYLAHICWFSNQKFSEAKVKRIIEEFNKNVPTEENYMSENFSETFFSHDVCLKIGFIREEIETLYINKDINDKERAMLITSLLYACDKIANTCGHYDAYRQGVEYNNNFVMEYPEQFDNLQNNKCYCMDSNELASKVKCDLAYLDPPYNSRQYSDAYHLLENIARWEKPEVKGVAKKMDRSSLKSDYCTVKATESFADLINKLDCRYILLSYNNTSNKANDRSNAKITDEDIMRILSAKGKVKVFSRDYKAFTTGKSHNNENEERLFLCEVQKPISSPLNYTGGKAKLLPQILPLFPSKINTFVDLMCGGGNVGVNVKANKHIYNDIDSNVVGLFKLFKETDYDVLIKDIDEHIDAFGLSETNKYGYDGYNCNSSDGMAEYNKRFYPTLKNFFNSIENKDNYYYEIFFTLIIFSFNNQIRYNSKGEFNLPVGKRDFNNKMREKLKMFSDRLKQQNTVFMSIPFNQFEYDFEENDFVYVDPPYLITTAAYNENGGWTNKDETELLSYLDKLNEKGVKFALSNVLKHKGKTNTLLEEWVLKNNYLVHHLNKSYNNSNYHSKNTDKETDEVLITNYQ